MSYNTQLQSNNTELEELLDSINSLPSKDDSQVVPTISINSSNGLITAIAGIKSSTYQLAFQSATTIIPSEGPQMAVSSGYYTGGNVIVDAIPTRYIVPSGTITISANGTHVVKSYASAIVNVEGSGEADYTNEDGLIDGSLTSYENSRVTQIRRYAFYNCSKLTSVNFPNATSIGGSAFYNCSKLTSVNFPNATSIGNYAFYSCNNLTSVSFPNATSIGSSAFYNCNNLTSVNFPNASYIGSNAFAFCSKLTTASFPKVTSIRSYAFTNCQILSSLTLGTSSVCTLSHSNAFSSTPYAGYSTYFSGTPCIYVPSSLVDAYKSATNWTYFSSYIVSISRPDGSGVGGGSSD